MILRIWHGYTTPHNADAYAALLREHVIPGIEAKNIPGYLGIDVLRRDLPHAPHGPEVEFITIMRFESLDAVRRFVGDDYEQVYVPDRARAVLSRFDDRSQHYDLIDSRTFPREPAFGHG